MADENTQPANNTAIQDTFQALGPPDQSVAPQSDAPAESQAVSDAVKTLGPPQQAQMDTSAPSSANNVRQGYLQEFSSKIQEAYNSSKVSQIRESTLGHAVSDGTMSLEDAQKKINDDEATKWQSEDVDQYEKKMWANWAIGLPTSIGVETAKALPFFEQAAVPYAGGAAVGGGAALATGVGAPAALPVAALSGMATSAGWAINYLYGQEYLKRRMQGASDQEAKQWGYTSALGQGMLQALQVDNLAKVPINAARVPLEMAKPGLVKAFVNFSQKFLMQESGGQLTVQTATNALKGTAGNFVVKQTLLGEAQVAVDLMMSTLEGTIHKHPDMVSTVEEAVKEVQDTFKKTVASSIGLHAAGKLAGKPIGFSLKVFGKVLKRTNETHLQMQQAKFAQIDQTPDEQLSRSQLKGKVERTERRRSKAQVRREARLEKRNAAENEVRRIFNAANSKFVIESDESFTKEKDRIQKVLKGLINKSDLLDDKTKAALLTRVPSIDSTKDLLRMGEKFLDDTKTAEERTQLDKAKKDLQKAIDAGQPRTGNKAKLTPTVQASLQYYDEFFTPEKLKGTKENPVTQDDIKAHMAKKAGDYIDAGFKGEVDKAKEAQANAMKGTISELFQQPAHPLEKLRIAQEAFMYWSGQMDTEAINRLADEVKETVDENRAQFLEDKEAQNKAFEQKRQKVLKGVQGKNEVIPSTEVKQGKIRKKEFAVKSIINALTKTNTALADELFQDTPPDERDQYVKIIDQTNSENKQHTLDEKSAQKLQELLSDALDSDWEKAQRLVFEGSKEELFSQSYTDIEGNAQILGRTTLNELLYLHLAIEDHSAIPGLVRGNKYTLAGMVEDGQLSTQEVVNHILEQRADGKYLDLGDAIRNFYQWYAPQIKNHYLKLYGVELPTHEDYSGKLQHTGTEVFGGMPDLLDTVTNYSKGMITPSSTITRSGSSLPVKLVNPFNQAVSHFRQFNFWIANSEQASELTYIFSDSSKNGLKDVIAYKLTPQFNNLIDGRLAYQYHLKPGIFDASDSALGQLTGNLATGILGADFTQPAKQLASTMLALTDVSVSEFMNGLANASNKEKLTGYLSRSEIYKARQGQIIPQVLEATNSSEYLNFTQKDSLQKFKEFNMIPMSKWGDGTASAITGYIGYEAALKQGASIEEAVLAGDRLVDKTQSSTRPSQRVPAEMKGGFGKTGMTFAKQGIQEFNLMASAGRDMLKHPSPKTYTKAAKMFLAGFTANAIYQAINSAPGWVLGNETEKEQSTKRWQQGTFSYPIGVLPLGIGDAAGGVTAAIDESGQSPEPTTIVGNITKSLAQTGYYTTKLVKEIGTGQDIEMKDVFHAFKAWSMVGSIASGIPFYRYFINAQFAGKVYNKATGN